MADQEKAWHRSGFRHSEARAKVTVDEQEVKRLEGLPCAALYMYDDQSMSLLQTVRRTTDGVRANSWRLAA